MRKRYGATEAPGALQIASTSALSCGTVPPTSMRRFTAASADMAMRYSCASALVFSAEVPGKYRGRVVQSAHAPVVAAAPVATVLLLTCASGTLALMATLLVLGCV